MSNSTKRGLYTERHREKKVKFIVKRKTNKIETLNENSQPIEDEYDNYNINHSCGRRR